MGTQIINRGRGPEIAGTRITVYDVVDYLQEGWRYDQIAGLFRLPPDDIQAAIQYIEDHKEVVMTAYRQKLQAKLAEIQAGQPADAPAARRGRLLLLAASAGDQPAQRPACVAPARTRTQF